MRGARTREGVDMEAERTRGVPAAFPNSESHPGAKARDLTSSGWLAILVMSGSECLTRWLGLRTEVAAIGRMAACVGADGERGELADSVIVDSLLKEGSESVIALKGGVIDVMTCRTVRRVLSDLPT